MCVCLYSRCLSWVLKRGHKENRDFAGSPPKWPFGASRASAEPVGVGVPVRSARPGRRNSEGFGFVKARLEKWDKVDPTGGPVDRLVGRWLGCLGLVAWLVRCEGTRKVGSGNSVITSFPSRWTPFHRNLTCQFMSTRWTYLTCKIMLDHILRAFQA